MRSTANLLASGKFAEGTIESNAFLEAFVIHARNIAHFFSPKYPRDDDVVVCHFIDDRVVVEEIKKAVDKDLSAARARTGKEIAHLTYERNGIKPSEKGWNVVDLAEKLSALVGIFLEKVDSEKISQRLKDEKMLRALSCEERSQPARLQLLHGHQSSQSSHPSVTTVSSSSATNN